MDDGRFAIRWWHNVSSISFLGTAAWRWVVGVGSAIILLLGLYKQIHPQYLNPLESDFYAYYQAALAVRGGGNPFTPVAAWIHTYRLGDALNPSYYVYAPFFALLIVPFTVVPWEISHQIWGLVNVVFLVGAVYALLRAMGERPSVLAMLVLTTAASLIGVVRLEFYWGQADILVLFLLCAALWARQSGHPVLAGILLAIACVTKPPMLLFAAYLLWKREYRFVVTTVIGFLAFLLVPFLFLGGSTLHDQLDIWTFWSNQYASFIDNQAFKGVLVRLFTINPYVPPILDAPLLATTLWLALAAGVALLLITVIKPRPLQSDLATLVEIGMVISAMLLISPLTEYIYLTLLIVPLIALYVFVRRHGWESPAGRRVAVAALVIWGLLCFPLQNVELGFMHRMGAGQPLDLLYVFLAVPYLYLIIATLALCIYATAILTGQRPSVQTLVTMVRQFDAQELVSRVRAYFQSLVERLNTINTAKSPDS